MICPNCGKESSANAQKCKFCDYEFTDEDRVILDISEAAIKEQVPIRESEEYIYTEAAIPEQVPFLSAEEAQHANNTENNSNSEKIIESTIEGEEKKKILKDSNKPETDAIETAVDEEFPDSEDKGDKKTEEHIYTEAAISEQVPFLSAEEADIATKDIENNIESAHKNEEDKILKDSNISEIVALESAIDEEFQGSKNAKNVEKKVNPYISSIISEQAAIDLAINEQERAKAYTASILSEQAILDASVNSEQPQNDIDEKDKENVLISGEILEGKDKKATDTDPLQSEPTEEKQPDSIGGSGKKKRTPVLFFIIAIALTALLLIYFNPQLISGFGASPTPTPQATSSQSVSANDDFNASIVETQLNGKTYYSLLVSGNKNATVTVNDKDTYDLDGKSISIPINVSDYAGEAPEAHEVTESIKVKIVSSDQKETNITLEPYTFIVPTPAIDTAK